MYHSQSISLEEDHPSDWYLSASGSAVGSDTQSSADQQQHDNNVSRFSSRLSTRLYFLIGNKFRSSQPNIVLSKLRVADLPIEHKRARLFSEQSTTVCEDRWICELILAGSEPQSNILQNILWNLATR